MDTGFTRLPRPLAHIESFLHETTSIEAPVPDRSSPRDVLLSTLATLPLIDTLTIDAITKAIDDELGEEEFRILLRRADAGDPAIVNRLDAQGFTALTLATLRGDYARVDLLLTCCRRIDVDQPNKRGDTPLMIAASGGDYVITGRLIDAGADPARENHQGRSPLLMTFKNWNNEERIGYSLTYQSLLGALKGMLAKGGEAKHRAEAALRAATQKAYPNVQAEQWCIIRVLTAE